jgi:hypothetical protein
VPVRALTSRLGRAGDAKPIQAIGQSARLALVRVMINPSMNASTTVKIPQGHIWECRDWHPFPLSPAAALEGSPTTMAVTARNAFVVR